MINEENENCNLCKESNLEVNQKTQYGAIIIYKLGNIEDGWFATLSPKTGGNPEKDFTIQIMSQKHLTNFSEMDSETAKNYGLIFSKVSIVMKKIMEEEIPDFKDPSEARDSAVSIATYGKCTTWKEKKEHLHIKLFPFRGTIGQPYTVDSSFGRKEIFKDSEREFVKMTPVRKTNISDERHTELAKKMISYLNGNI